MPSENEAQIVTLLRETESAHGAYERNVLAGERDNDWPIWYATYLFDKGLAGLLPAIGHADVSTLAAMLAQLQEEYQRDRPPSSWPEYYAERLSQEPRPSEQE